MSTNTRVLQAFARLEGNSDWSAVREFLAAERDDHGKTAMQSTDLLMIGRGQGGYGAIDRILELADNARSYLDKYAGPRGHR